MMPVTTCFITKDPRLENNIYLYISGNFEKTSLKILRARDNSEYKMSWSMNVRLYDGY